MCDNPGESAARYEPERPTSRLIQTRNERGLIAVGNDKLHLHELSRGVRSSQGGSLTVAMKHSSEQRNVELLKQKQEYANHTTAMESLEALPHYHQRSKSIL